MKYKDKNLDTYPEIIDYALSLKGDEQREFVEAYAKTGPYALQKRRLLRRLSVEVKGTPRFPGL